MNNYANIDEQLKHVNDYMFGIAKRPVWSILEQYAYTLHYTELRFGDALYQQKSVSSAPLRYALNKAMKQTYRKVVEQLNALQAKDLETGKFSYDEIIRVTNPITSAAYITLFPWNCEPCHYSMTTPDEEMEHCAFGNVLVNPWIDVIGNIHCKCDECLAEDERIARIESPNDFIDEPTSYYDDMED